jgi:dihydrofolate synthase/folylpolyglutamate synthase
VVDGAHNPESAARLRAALRRHFPGRRLTLVLGILNDKDVEGIAIELTPVADRIVVVGADSPRAAPAERIIAAVRAAGGQPEIAPSVTVAVQRGLATLGSSDIMCVTGSLMTVAEARAAVGLADPTAA